MRQITSIESPFKEKSFKTQRDHFSNFINKGIHREKKGVVNNTHKVEEIPVTKHETVREDDGTSDLIPKGGILDNPYYKQSVFYPFNREISQVKKQQALKLEENK